MTEDEQHQHDTRIQPRDLEEAKVWIAQLRTQLEFHRNSDKVWQERIEKIQDRLAEAKERARIAEESREREMAIVDYFIRRSRYDD